MDLDYQIKLFKPDRAHKSYRLYKRWDSTKAMEKIESEALDLVNRGLRDGTLGKAEADRLAVKIREDAKRARDAQKGLPVLFFNNDNLKLLDDYLTNSYLKRRKVKAASKHRRKVELKRAVGMLNQVSLRVASEDEITDKLFESIKDPGIYNAMAGCLNSILKYAQRDVRIQTLSVDYQDITYLNEAEFKTILGDLPDDGTRLACRVAFATGARWGECLGMETDRIKVSPKSGKVFIYINQQWHVKDKKYDPPKRGKRRDTLVMTDYIEDVRLWCTLTLEQRLEVGSPSDTLLAATVKRWPSKANKRCTVHSLRHSYATHLLQRGVSLSLVARFLGNHLKVTELYYAAFTFGDDELHLPAGL